MGFNISNLTEIFNRPSPQAVPTIQGPLGDSRELKSNIDTHYKVLTNNWYSAKPYGFKFTTKNNNSSIMFLPISPQNLTITTDFATNIIPTLYGTIEEHSDVRYYDISIEGNTGVVPNFVEPGVGNNASILYSQLRNQPKPNLFGRLITPIANSIGAGGFLSNTLRALNQAKDKAADILDGGRKAQAGLSPENSGYVAFHNLYRCLLQYKKDVASGNSNRTKHPLIFFNYKDNNQYYVSVKSFVLRKSADNPMLYQYSIQLRGYRLSGIDDEIDENLTQRLSDLGLNGVDSSSVLGDMKSLSSQTKGIIGSFVGGINILGR